MKYYRQWQPFRGRRRRRQQQILIFILGLLTISLVGFFLFNSNETELITSASSLSRCNCSKTSLILFKHGECFFDQIMCYPGFGGNQCEIQLKNEVKTNPSHCIPKYYLFSDLSITLSIRYTSNEMDG